MSLTKNFNDLNVDSVRRQIKHKQSSKPYMASIQDTTSVVTDMDNFPYNRFFRGVYHSSDPVVMEREAGWRPVQNNCYNTIRKSEKDSYPRHCWESACSTVYPCYPEYLAKYSDRGALNVQLNRACIVQYR